MTTQQAFEMAVLHHQCGRLAEAEVIYRQILGVEPRHADALNNLGVIAHQVGRHDIAVESIRQAILLVPGSPDFHSNLGAAYRAMGQLDEAIAAYHQAILCKPAYAEAHNNLGNALREKRQLDEAVAAYREAIVHRPAYAEAHNNLGQALRDKGELHEAVAAYRRAIILQPENPDSHYSLGIALVGIGLEGDAVVAWQRAIKLRPDYAEAYNNIGYVLQTKGRIEEAVVAYRTAITINPGYAEAHSNLGNALWEKGHLDEAIISCRKAVALRPVFAEAWNNLGIALKDRGHREEAIAAFHRAIVIKPAYPEAYSNLGNVIGEKGQADEAIAACRRAIALNPGYAEAYSNLGNALRNRGELDEAIAAFRQAIMLKPNLRRAHGNLLFTLNYLPRMDAQAVAEEHRDWSRRHAEPLRQFIQPHRNEPTQWRRLRIGYVSPDFREHSVACFVENLIANHDGEQVEVFCYSDVRKPDAVTERIKCSAGKWCEIMAMSDAEVDALVRKDGIDILVDLTGHTANNRLLVFARRPAPVQVTWLGYPNTTGLDTMDYRLTDAFADPPGSTDHLHTEPLFRLPGCAWCFRPLSQICPASPVSFLPLKGTGCITFGCFNAMPKINEPLLRLWSEILLAVPDSRLLLKNSVLLEPSAQQRVRAVLGGAGIAPDRIELMGHVSENGDHLASYRRVDISLDTFPYHGTTTTCEALWMGVPVVSLAGSTHVSRVGVSLLNHLGLPELLAGSPEEYLRLAVGLARDPARLANLRSTLRGRMEASPLMDAPRFARNMEAAYREMWRKWCADGG